MNYRVKSIVFSTLNDSLTMVHFVDINVDLNQLYLALFVLIIKKIRIKFKHLIIHFIKWSQIIKYQISLAFFVHNLKLL